MDAINPASTSLPIPGNPKASRFSGSVVTQIQTKMKAASTEAKSETLENIGFTLGERMKSIDKEEKKPKANLRETLYNVVKTFPANTDMKNPFSQLEEAMGKFSSRASLKQYLISLFRDPGMVAIIIQMYLQKKQRKKILSDILDEMINEFGEDSSIVLFSALQFGAGNQETKKKINQLYNQAAQQFLGISDFYKKLKQQISDSKKRKKAVISMLHSFAEDIHDASEGLFKIKIVHVIKELRRLSTVLSMDSACKETAEFMANLKDKNTKKISGENILSIVIEWLDVTWIYDAMIQEKMASFYIASLPSQAVFLQKMLALFKSLPIMCYESEEGGSHIIETIQKEINKISAAEEIV